MFKDLDTLTLSSEQANEKAIKLWHGESLGGLTEDNNRTPVPVVWLLILTVLTAFFVTFPLWGQRPTAAIYSAYIKSMDSPEVMAIQDDTAAMQKITEMNKDGPYEAQLVRHPVTMDDLRILKPQVEDLQKKGLDLGEYTVVGNKIVIANFEGNWRPDGTRVRKQPWWDKGYFIDIFFIIFFFTGVVLVVKGLPSYSWQPDHSGHDRH
jgi:hypothetical protein